MADNNGHKSGSFGFFNPDDRLKQIINDIASTKDLKSLRCTFLLLLEHPEIKPKFIGRYGEQAFKEVFEKYNVTIKTETENYKRKEDAQKKARIQAFQVLGFSQEDSEKLSDLSSEDLKTLAYIKQNAPQNRINQEEKRKESREYRKLLEEKQTYEFCIQQSEERQKANPEHIEGEQQIQTDNKAKLAKIEQKIQNFLSEPQT
jgi:hypothetical protein